MSKDIALTSDDGFPSDFTMKRVSESKRSPGKVLAYHHLLLGWVGPQTAFMLKLITENAKDVINWGYQVNFKLMEILTPQGSLAGEIVTLSADIALFAALKNYADKTATEKGTYPKFEYAKLLAIMAMPYGMVILVGMAVYEISDVDWVEAIAGPEAMEPLGEVHPKIVVEKIVKGEGDIIKNILDLLFGFFKHPVPGPLQP